MKSLPRHKSFSTSTQKYCSYSEIKAQFSLCKKETNSTASVPIPISKHCSYFSSAGSSCSPQEEITCSHIQARTPGWRTALSFLDGKRLQPNPSLKPDPGIWYQGRPGPPHSPGTPEQGDLCSNCASVLSETMRISHSGEQRQLLLSTISQQKHPASQSTG